MSDRTIERQGVQLSLADDGEGVPVVLLHGLTATRRYVVMGSRALERSGHRVIAYDARGHGASSPATEPGAYGYEELELDLEAVLDQLGIQRAVLAGSSMGAHTIVRFALRHPERVGGLVVITPAYDPGTLDRSAELERWDALAGGLERGGIEGFVAAYGEPAVAPALRETVIHVIRQRLAQHEHPEAVADALRVVPRSRPFESLEQLRALALPVTIVASNDEADPGHPRAVGEAYVRVIPNARLVTDEPGRSPVAWQGSQLSRLIGDVADQAQLGDRGPESGASSHP